MNIYTRGFTLIELLVVIAIIGILTSVIMGSLNAARDKGADASVKVNLRGVRDQSAIYYDNGGYSYTDLCSEPTISKSVTSSKGAMSASSTLGGLGDGECSDSDSEYAVWVNLKASPTSAWCVDSLGESKIIPAQDSSTVDLLACP